MSLVKCKSCGHEVSKKAEKCPNCGEPQKRKSVGCMGAVGIIVLAVVFAAVFVQKTGKNSSGTGSTTPAAKQAVKLDCSIQDDRKELIQKMISQGYWEKVNRPATLMTISVMPLFMASATLDDKKKLVSVVSAYDRCTGGDGLIVIVDAMNGKRLGTFGDYGLDLD